MNCERVSISSCVDMWLWNLYLHVQSISRFEVITVYLTNSSLHQYEMLIKQTEWLRSMRIEFRQPTDKLGHGCWTPLDSNHDFER